MKTISGIEFASEHNGTDVFRVIELAYEQGRKDGHSEQLGTNLAEVGTDCISRQAAIDTVNSRKTAEQCKEGEVRNWTVDACVDMIKKMPPAQPEIVRCKDCKHWDGVDTCDVIDAPVWDNDFCSMAERRTDE